MKYSYLPAVVLLLVLAATPLAFSSPLQAESSCAEWLAALGTAQEKLVGMNAEQRRNASRTLWRKLAHDYPVYMDWLLQDAFEDGLWEQVNGYGKPNKKMQQALLGQCLADLLVSMDGEFWRGMLFRVVNPMMKASPKLPDGLVQWMFRSDTQPIPEMAALYLEACAFRRTQRLAPMLEQAWDSIVFAQHFNMGASHYAYTEGLSDAQRERHFYPGAKITLLRFDETQGTPETLLEDKNGVIRDVDISWDGERIVFAWKKSDFEDDYSLYEMNLDTREIRAITSGLGHADYEAVYAPNGDILFNSTRCVQIVDCWWTEVSNLYTCAADGSFLRRLAFDQVHDNYPTITEDGRVLYTRWDYNDRGQIYPQGLFEMLPDGTAQQAFYGNNSWFPTTILHARHIPGTNKVVAIFTGHHSWQAGKLGVLDPALGREENSGAQLIAPVRETPAERIDAYGQDGDLFKYPYPLGENHFLVSYTPLGWETRGAPHQMHRPEFTLYLMDAQGNRELLYRDNDSNLSVGRMVPVTARAIPAQRPESVDYTKATGTYYIQDIHAGPGLEGLPRGAVKKLRVVALEYRAAGIGDNRNNGVAGGALISTPIAIGNGSWDVKVPLGDATIYEDGSAMFEVPARMPVYFQALDEKGRTVQSMRSWSTLQPGETQSCVGCHENKNTTPLMEASPTLAMRSGAYPLKEAYGTPSGFSFRERIQPILDRHCINCHYGEHDKPEASNEEKHAFSLMNVPVHDEQSKRNWNEAYLKLTAGGPEAGPVRWISSQSAPPMLDPGKVGALTSPLIHMLEEGHNDVQLSDEETRMLSCWIDLAVPFCGDYTEANAWTDEEKAMYRRFAEKRKKMERKEADNIKAYLQEKGL